MEMFEIKDLHVCLADQDKEILHGVNLEVVPGEIHALMGPNGSGKSTFAHAIMGNPKYKVTSGSIVVDGEPIDHLPTHERARLGIFTTMQHPIEVPGVPVEALLLRGYGDVTVKVADEARILNIDPNFLERGVNEGFSGGERKRMETLQLAVSQAQYAILDEVDSGLDIDALRSIASRIKSLATTNALGVVAITHYDRLLTYLDPTHVHVFIDGQIIESGGIELAKQLEKDGYGSFLIS